MIRNAAAALMLVLGFAVVPAAAAESSVATLSTAAVAAASAASAGTEAAPLAADTDWSLPAVKLGSGPSTRGAILPSLYASLAALNAYDAVSTRSGLSRGAVESNPAMQAIVGHSTSLVAVKAVATASTILVAEHLWKNHHKGQAIAMMVISNGMMALVAAHNASVINGIGR
jgi:hypothetical protein